MTIHTSHNELHNELHPRWFSPRRVLVCNWACRDWLPVLIGNPLALTTDLLSHYWLTIPFSPAVFPALNLSTTLLAPTQLTHSVLTVYGCSYHYFTMEVRVQQAFDYQMVYLCELSMERLFHRRGKEKAHANHTVLLQNALFLSSSCCCGNYLRVSRTAVGTLMYSVCLCAQICAIVRASVHAVVCLYDLVFVLPIQGFVLPRAMSFDWLIWKTDEQTNPEMHSRWWKVIVREIGRQQEIKIKSRRVWVRDVAGLKQKKREWLWHIYREIVMGAY